MRPILLVLSVSLALLCSSAKAASPPDGPASASSGSIRGAVKNSVTGEPIEAALVILTCTCLSEHREAMTDARGLYQFTELPTGRYEAVVLSGHAEVTKAFRLPRQANMRANYSIDRFNPVPLRIEVMIDEPRSNSPETAKRLPIPHNAAFRCVPIPLHAFWLQDSLFDGGDMQRITGGPRVTRSLP